MTETGHESVVSYSQDLERAAAMDKAQALRQEINKNIRTLGLDPETMFLDRRGKRWKYRSQTLQRAIDSSSKPTRP